jgi:hypothetical protein
VLQNFRDYHKLAQKSWFKEIIATKKGLPLVKKSKPL